MRKITLIAILAFCYSAVLFSQQNKIDSLKKAISKAAEDTNKVKLYLMAGREVIYQDPNKALVFYFAGVRLSEKINYPLGTGLCFLSIGNTYSFLSKTDSSLIYSDSSLVYLRKTNSATYLANLFGNRADTYVQISDFKKALQDCDTATKYIEQSGSKLQLAFIYNIRADIYWHLKQYQLNKEYVNKALEIHEETGNTRMVGQAYSDIADWYAINKVFDTSVIYYLKAIHIADSINDESNLSRYHSSLSDTYLQMNKINAAASAGLQALKYAEAEDNPVQKAFVHTLLCRIYTSQNNQELAIRHGRLGHFMAMQEIDFPLQQSSASALAAAFKKNGNLDSAYYYLNVSKDLNDSLLTKNFNNETANLQVSFDVSQKEKQIELLAKDKELQQQRLKQQNVYIVASVATALLALLGIWLAVNRYSLRQRMKQLELRNQIAADLHDEVGSSLSSIHMLSQMATKQGDESTHKDILEKMSNNAKETIEKMGDIVWMIKPGEKEASSLKIRMERFAYDICVSKNISLTLQIDDLETVKLSMEQRKNIYLIFKEAINNAVKYSGTEQIEVTASLQNKELLLLVKDFGKGFDVSLIKKGNGLDNMHNRAIELKGTLLKESNENNGTVIQLTVPV